MSKCKFRNRLARALHRCKEERAEFDRVFLDVKTVHESERQARPESLK